MARVSCPWDKDDDVDIRVARTWYEQNPNNALCKACRLCVEEKSNDKSKRQAV